MELIAVKNVQDSLSAGDVKNVRGILLAAAVLQKELKTLQSSNRAWFLNDKDVYLGNQIEKKDSDRCYGVVANEDFILVSEYGCNGAEPKIVLYKENKK